MTKRYWWVIIVYIITLFAAVIYAPILYKLFSLSNTEAVIYGTVLSFIIGLIIILFIMKPAMKLERNEEGVPSTGMLIFWSITGVFMALAAQTIAASIETNLFGIEAGSENTSMIMDIARNTPIFMVIPMFFAPILEEIVFRKIIFGSLYKRMNFFFAALLSALVFGIIHQEPLHILIYASMGFIFAYLYVKTKRILVPIFVHMGMNSITVLLQYSLTPEDLERMQEELEQMQTIIGG